MGASDSSTVSLTIQGQPYGASNCVLEAGAGQGIAAGALLGQRDVQRCDRAATQRTRDIQGQIRIENCAQE